MLESILEKKHVISTHHFKVVEKSDQHKRGNYSKLNCVKI